jgi:hypothetical protein
MREWRLVQKIALGAGTAGWIRTTDLLIHSYISPPFRNSTDIDTFAVRL